MNAEGHKGYWAVNETFETQLFLEKGQAGIPHKTGPV